MKCSTPAPMQKLHWNLYSFVDLLQYMHPWLAQLGTGRGCNLPLATRLNEWSIAQQQVRAPAPAELPQPGVHVLQQAHEGAQVAAQLLEGRNAAVREAAKP